MQEAIEFRAGGATTLRGVLYLPDVDGEVPGVVMSHGFSAVKEMGLPAFAEAICDAGCAVLLYDHRGLGASDGEPRQQVDPWAQAADMRDALGWLGGRPEVDAERLGLWGSSFSGGEVLMLGAVDERVRAAVVNVPFAGFPDAEYGDTTAVIDAIRAGLADGSLAAEAAASPMGPFSVVEEAGNELSPFLGQPESAAWFLAVGAGTSWRNEVTVGNAFGTDPPFDPGVAVARLRCPVLFVVASDDRVAETGVALRAYERAPEPKELLMLDGDHFALYSGESQVRAADAAAAWFARFLRD